MARKLTHFLFIFFSYLLFHKTSAQSSAKEKQILLNMKNDWGNPLSLCSWNLTGDHCKFAGIHCSRDGIVDGISLHKSSISFPIPASICDLKGLTFLDLSDNNISGEFPTILYNCSKLQELDISNNYFVGELPADINRMPSNLTHLLISGNDFTGDIPPAIGRLPAINFLVLYANLFNGTIPAEMGNLSTLQTLSLAFNPFSPARILPEFGNLTSLTDLLMSNMNLLGEIPKSFGKLANLEYLNLGANSLVGEIPTSVWMIKPLKYLYLYANKLTGEISSTVAADGLLEIDFARNQLTGSIPEAFGELKNLWYLNLCHNDLSGEVPASISRLSNLENILLYNNSLEGVLSPEIGKYSQLSYFEVENNMFSGELPEHLCDGKSLIYLSAYDNRFTGKLPESLGSCDTLLIAQMQNNQLTGTLPDKLPSNLTWLDLQNNQLNGTLPDKLPLNLSWLQIQNNHFCGRIPSPPRGLLEFIGGNNSFSGELPTSFIDMSLLQRLSLSRNQISGEIPADIRLLKYLTDLDLSNNHLSGQIPDTMGFMILKALDLSNNELSGEIPSSFGISNFTFLNLSFNDLTGEIPVLLQTQTYEESFLANTKLCASNSFSGIQICKNRLKKLSTGLQILFYILGALIFSVVILCFFIPKERRRRKKADTFPSDWKLTSFQVINFNESDILNRLTDDNLVGSGGGGKVYRVSLNLNNTVAVKKIHNIGKLDFILEKQFEAEVKILGSIRHDNIVKLLCCISGKHSKLLVYEYLENSSLDRWLHHRRRGNATPLDWPTRLQIAVGAAKGLCYLHHHCFSPIIHRDVKSSNILLDHKFDAKIADFGLAKILVRGGEMESVSAVAGSFGYMAPECRTLGKVNEKVDVYSFGVVLFELVTGREARDGGEEEYENLTDWVWRRYKDKGAVVDEEIVGESLEWVKEAEMMFKIGLICTVYNPSERPTMKEVVQMLLMLGRSSDSNGSGGGDNINSSGSGSGRDVIVGVQIVDIMEDSDDIVATPYNAFQSL